MKEYTGRVKWMNIEKGYGFIYCFQTKKDIFFHVEQVMMEGRVLLEPDTRVEFQIVSDFRGDKAINVYLSEG